MLNYYTNRFLLLLKNLLFLKRPCLQRKDLSLELKSKKRALYFALYSQELKAMDEELAYNQLLEISFQVRYQLHCIFVSWGARVPPPPVHNI